MFKTNARNADHDTLLALAVKKDQGLIIQHLISKGVELDDTTRGYTPLMWAASYGYVSAFNILCTHGANGP